jgi:uncharacterized RDD family membrane protein YckC
MCPASGTRLLGGPPRPPHDALRVDAPLTVAAVASTAAAQVVDTTPQRVRIGYAGFWIRVLAWFCDNFVGSALALLAVRISGPIGALIVLPFLLLYQPLMESSAWQGTVGKRICGLAVTDLRGQRISFLRALARLLAKLLSAALFGLGFVMVAFTPRKRGLHDIIAGTLVEWRTWRTS